MLRTHPTGPDPTLGTILGAITNKEPIRITRNWKLTDRGKRSLNRPFPVLDQSHPSPWVAYLSLLPMFFFYGAGSIGGVYLYQLLQAGCNVTAVCRSNYATVKTNGFRLSSVRYGDVTFSPTVVVRDVSECSNETFDFVLVCTKSFPGSKPPLPEQLGPVLEGRPQTTIVLAQNGIMIEEEIAAAYPQNAILSGVVYCPAVQTGPGTIEYPEMLNLLELGTYPSKAPQPHRDAARTLRRPHDQGRRRRGGARGHPGSALVQAAHERGVEPHRGTDAHY